MDVTPTKRWTLLTSLTFTILILTTIVLVLTSIVSFNMSRRTKQHAIVFDAGSTHTQMLIFSWLSDKSDGAFDTAWVKQSFSLDKQPGISSFTSPVRRAVREYFGPLLDQADDIIGPLEVRSRTNVLLGATAGMRLLEMESREMSHSILSEIRKFIEEHGYKVADIRIISGSEEALYGWISANILTSKINPWTKRCSPVAITDLGGASMQVAFETNREIETNKIVLYGQTFNVYAKSFLCWGKEQSHYRYLNILRRISSENKIEDPCSARGHSYQHSLTDLLSNVCVSDAAASNTILSFMGTGDSNACSSLVSKMFEEFKVIGEFNDAGGREGESIDSMIRSERDRQRFIAFSGFYHVWRAMGSPQGWNQYHHTLSLICSKDAQVLVAQNIANDAKTLE